MMTRLMVSLPPLPSGQRSDDGSFVPLSARMTQQLVPFWFEASWSLAPVIRLVRSMRRGVRRPRVRMPFIVVLGAETPDGPARPQEQGDMRTTYAPGATLPASSPTSTRVLAPSDGAL
jgi:hypothetical protein